MKRTQRRILGAGLVTMLAATGSLVQVQARERVTDGWLHSVAGQQERVTSEPTDGWMHSHPTSETSTANDSITDGWLNSTVTEAFASSDGKGIETARVGAGAPATDGWLHSLVAESAGSSAPENQVATTTGFPTEIAVGSSLLATALIAAGIVVFLRRRRYTSITA